MDNLEDRRGGCGGHACSQALCNSEGNDRRTFACKMTARESLTTFRARVTRRSEVHGSCRAGAWAARGETGLGPRSGPLGILLCRLTPLGRRDERRGKLRRSHRLLAVVGVFNSPSRGMQDRKKPEIDNGRSQRWWHGGGGAQTGVVGREGRGCPENARE